MDILKKTALLTAAVMLTACSMTAQEQNDGSSPAAEASSVFTGVPENAAGNKIILEDGNITLKGTGMTSSGNTVTISSAGTYMISGSLSDGQIYVEAGKKDTVTLVLCGAEITNSSGPAIYAEKAKLLSVVLNEGTENTVRSGDERDVLSPAEEENASGGALQSKTDLCFSGTGTLNVYGYINNGIQTSDALSIDGGNYVIKASGNGIKGKDSVKITSGSFDVTSGGDGIKSDNDKGEGYGVISLSGGVFTVIASGDGFQAESAIEITGGSYDITTGGGAGELSPSDDFPGFMAGGGFPGGFDRDDLPDGNGGRPGRPDGNRPGRDENGFKPDFENAPDNMPEMPDISDFPPDFYPDLMPDFDSNKDKDDEGGVSTKGFKCGGSIKISGGTFTLDTADDSFHCDGDLTVTDGVFTVSSGDDAFHSGSSFLAEGGTIAVKQANEGIEANILHISGGDISINAADDGLNAYGKGKSMLAPELVISGGNLYVNSYGDGLDSNGDLKIEGGTVIVDGPQSGGNGAIDYGTERGADCLINGGTVFASGNSMMAETFSESSKQCSFMYNFSSMIPAGTEIIIKSSDGNELFRHETVKQVNSVVFSSQQLKEGMTCTITAGDQTGEVTLDSISVKAGETSRGWGR